MFSLLNWRFATHSVTEQAASDTEQKTGYGKVRADPELWPLESGKQPYAGAA